MVPPHSAALPAPGITRRGLLVAVACSVLLWSIGGVALSASVMLDQQRAGQPITLHQALWRFLPTMTPQMLFSVLVALLLQARPQLLLRPARLAGWALLSVPVYLLASTPVVVMINLLTKGKPLADLSEALSQWAAVNIWVDGITCTAGLGVQLGWAFWRHGQRQQQFALRTQADLAELRLTLLQGQLEPHFLFNTLNSIAALVRGAERNVALLALNRLSELLRYSLRASQQRWVSVADELRFVDDYLALQRLRFGEALRWQAEIQDGDWDHVACPPLLLQPLVENAIRYGLEAGDGEALGFSVRCADKALRIDLHNPRHEGGQLLAGHGLGLAKSRERLQMLYGDRASITTEVGVDRFHLTLHLPLEDLDGALERADR